MKKGIGSKCRREGDRMQKIVYLTGRKFKMGERFQSLKLKAESRKPF
jgi:hypothetical protein